MKNAENTMQAKENVADNPLWLVTAKQTDSLRQRNKQLRQKQKAQQKEQNERFRSLVNHCR